MLLFLFKPIQTYTCFQIKLEDNLRKKHTAITYKKWTEAWTNLMNIQQKKCPNDISHTEDDQLIYKAILENNPSKTILKINSNFGKMITKPTKWN